MKDEALGKLKQLGNSILGNFGMSLDNFNMKQDEKTGSWNIRYNLWLMCSWYYLFKIFLSIPSPPTFWVIPKRSITSSFIFCALYLHFIIVLVAWAINEDVDLLVMKLTLSRRWSWSWGGRPSDSERWELLDGYHPFCWLHCTQLNRTERNSTELPNIRHHASRNREVIWTSRSYQNDNQSESHSACFQESCRLIPHSPQSKCRAVQCSQHVTAQHGGPVDR